MHNFMFMMCTTTTSIFPCHQEIEYYWLLGMDLIDEVSCTTHHLLFFLQTKGSEYGSVGSCTTMSLRCEDAHHMQHLSIAPPSPIATLSLVQHNRQQHDIHPSAHRPCQKYHQREVPPIEVPPMRSHALLLRCISRNFLFFVV